MTRTMRAVTVLGLVAAAGGAALAIGFRTTTHPSGRAAIGVPRSALPAATGS